MDSCTNPCVQVAGYGNKYLRKDGITRVTPDQISESVDKSLARLGTDYIDLLQVTVLRTSLSSR